MCPLMCMTMADPTWAFVLSAPEVWRLIVNLLRRCSLKSPCVTVPLPQLFFFNYVCTPAQVQTNTCQSNAHVDDYKPF